jgi:hypothetical protein
MFSIFPLVVAATLSQGPTADEVLKLAIKQRQAITRFSGTLRFRVEEPESNRAKEFERTYRFWLDAIQLRQDELSGEQVLAINCRNCEKKGQYIRCPTMNKDERAKVSIEFGSMPGEGRKGDANYHNMFLLDPRVIGLQAETVGVLHHYKLDTELGRTDRGPATLEKTKWNGHETYLIRFVVKTTKVKYSFWIVPTMDHSVVRIDCEGEGKYLKTVKCDMDRYGKPATWFPKSYVAELVVDGKLRWRDSMDLSDAKINEPVPASAFQLSGMGIPEGWPLNGSALPFKSKKGTWDGQKLIEAEIRTKKSAPPKKELSVAPSDLTPPRGLLLGVGAVMAMVGAIALTLFFWKR